MVFLYVLSRSANNFLLEFLRNESKSFTEEIMTEATKAEENFTKCIAKMVMY